MDAYPSVRRRCQYLCEHLYKPIKRIECVHTRTRRTDGRRSRAQISVRPADGLFVVRVSVCAKAIDGARSRACEEAWRGERRVE